MYTQAEKIVQCATLLLSEGGGWKLPGPERRLAIWRHAWSLHRYADHAE